MAAWAAQLYPNAQRTRFAHNVIDGCPPSIHGGMVFGDDADHASNGNVVENNVIAYAQTYNINGWWERAVGTGNIARDNCLSADRKGTSTPRRLGSTHRAMSWRTPVS